MQATFYFRTLSSLTGVPIFEACVKFWRANDFAGTSQFWAEFCFLVRGSVQKLAPRQMDVILLGEQFFSDSSQRQL